MTHCGFKNALLGEKCTLDQSWPCLSETNNIIKKTTKKNVPVTCHSLDVNHGIPTLSTGNVSSQTHSSEISVPFANDDFPELSCTFYTKKQSATVKSNSVIVTDSVLVSNTNYSKHQKNVKLKNGLLSIPLLSLVKIRINKKVLSQKKAPRLKHLSHSYCGNKLDSDNPLRRKGKVRLHKKKYVSRLRKEIILSKQIKNKHVAYDKDLLNVKALLPSIFNCDNDVAINKLGSLLGLLNLEEKQIKITESNTPQIEESIPVNFTAHKFAKRILHSNNYKEYCTNIVTKSLVESAERLVTTLRNFQDRQHAKDPGKAFAKRRYLCGFKETKKFLVADRVKIVIIATNLQLETDLPSGRVLEEITSICQEKNIPVIYAGRGNQIGYWTLKRRRISIISILNYEGAEFNSELSADGVAGGFHLCKSYGFIGMRRLGDQMEAYQKLIDTWTECKEMYKTALKEIEHQFPAIGEKEVVDKNIEHEIRDSVLLKLSENGNELIQ